MFQQRIGWLVLAEWLSKRAHHGLRAGLQWAQDQSSQRYRARCYGCGKTGPWRDTPHRAVGAVVTPDDFEDAWLNIPPGAREEIVVCPKCAPGFRVCAGRYEYARHHGCPLHAWRAPWDSQKDWATAGGQPQCPACAAQPLGEHDIELEHVKGLRGGVGLPSNADGGLYIDCRDSFTLRADSNGNKAGGTEYPKGTVVQLLSFIDRVKRGPRETFWSVCTTNQNSGSEVYGWAFIANAAIYRARHRATEKP